jgi:amino acid permease
LSKPAATSALGVFLSSLFPSYQLREYASNVNMSTTGPAVDTSTEKDASALKGNGSPDYGSGSEIVVTHEVESFWTRMGVSPNSFKRQRPGMGGDGLNQTLKPRHLHMIAIGGSIGAGFFVGSGSALSRGVRGPELSILYLVIDFYSRVQGRC